MEVWKDERLVGCVGADGYGVGDLKLAQRDMVLALLHAHVSCSPGMAPRSVQSNSRSRTRAEFGWLRVVDGARTILYPRLFLVTGWAFRAEPLGCRMPKIHIYTSLSASDRSGHRKFLSRSLDTFRPTTIPHLNSDLRLW